LRHDGAAVTPRLASDIASRFSCRFAAFCNKEEEKENSKRELVLKKQDPLRGQDRLRRQDKEEEKENSKRELVLKKQDPVRAADPVHFLFSEVKLGKRAVLYACQRAPSGL
jgi:hypothetical protein